MTSPKFTQKRKLVAWLDRSETWIDCIGLACLTAYILFRLPSLIFNTDPATGGDTGSHFWALWALANKGIPQGTLRLWNPGNYLGEPLLVHYFPFPFLAMWVLSLVLPLGMAFNIGTVLAPITMPIATYVCLRGLGTRFPAPLLGAMASMFFLFNESYTMLGGNFLSTFAGQFAHGYGINFMLVGLGVFGWEIRKGNPPFFSSLAFAGVFISHAYVFLGLPVAVVSVALFLQEKGLFFRLKNATLSLSFATLLSLWFLIPLLSNSPWTTAFAAPWGLEETLKEAFSKIFLPPYIGLVLGLICLSFIRKLNCRASFLRKEVSIWLLPIGTYVGLYVAAERLGIINARAVPQIMLFVLLIAALVFSFCLHRLGGRVFAWLVSLPLVFLTFFWIQDKSQNFESWANWNYSGWKSKPLYPNVEALSKKLHGDFSMPRVIYEHSPTYNAAGTTRVFEMLPYFAGRATLEGVYMQSTILAPMVFLLQAEISKAPSCPFWKISPCPKYNLGSAISHVKLMGGKELILTSAEILAQARDTRGLIERDTFGIFTLFELRDSVSLVETFREIPTFLHADLSEIKLQFLEWFQKYDGKQPFLVASVDKRVMQTPSAWLGSPECRAGVTVDFNRIKLTTDCPGKAHYLKFNFHPSWKANTGDKTFLVSPGFLGIVPSRPDVELTFGHDPLWKASSYLSLFSLLILPICYTGLSRRYRKVKVKVNGV